jgi:hypothetical protein
MIPGHHPHENARYPRQPSTDHAGAAQRVTYTLQACATTIRRGLALFPGRYAVRDTVRAVLAHHDDAPLHHRGNIHEQHDRHLHSTGQRLPRHTLAAATGGPLSCTPSLPTADTSGYCPDLARDVSVWDDGAEADGVPDARAAPCARALRSWHTASPLGSLACGETPLLPSRGRQSHEGDT